MPASPAGANVSGRPHLPIYMAGFLSMVVLLGCGPAGAEVRLPDIFGSNMVLQRDQPVIVWGTASTNDRVQVRLGPRSAVALTGADGNWQVTMEALTAGGPYELKASSGGTAVVLTNVYCGDVWLCSGQSNMQWPVKDVNPSEQQAMLAEYPDLRLCSVAKTPAQKPLSAAKINWRTCTPKAARDFSAVAFFFGTQLLKDPALAQVPIGLVDSSFGGTTCEGWIPRLALTNFKPQDLHDSMFGIKPANLYNGMIAPLGRTRFKGVLWYQGESNSAHPETYPALLATMISAWRQQFDQPNLPFLIVQLPEYANLWEGYYWPWIREQQSRVAASISNSALVVGIRTTDGFNLHPKEKLEIGRRAALVARRVAYGENLIASGPRLKSASTSGAAIRVTFDTDDGLSSANPDRVGGFAVAGPDGNYRFADARIDGNKVIVSSPDVVQPQTVRYAWAGMPQAGLVNKSGLPAAPFRTDTLPCSNVELQMQRATRRVATSAYEMVIDANGTVTSLILDGAQFLSNEPGTAGGSSIPGFWGPRTLNNIREIGPQLLACSDDMVSLQMEFADKSMLWTITNRGNETLTFQLALSPHVQVPEAITNGLARLVRGPAILNVEGFDTITNTLTGALLSTHIAAGATKSISLK